MTKKKWFRPLYLFLIIVLAAGCQRTDFDEVLRKQAAQQDQLDSLAARVTTLETAVKTANSDVASLKTIAAALQQHTSIKSYTATATGYLLTMSDGSTITLTNGRDGTNGTNGANGANGVNAPVIGVKQDTDGQYYWTLGGNFILQNGQQLRVTGNDGQNGTSGITPQLQVNSTTNQWLISYDGGASWQVVKDGNGNPIAATGPQGPAGIPGFSMEAKGDYVIITYTVNGQTQSYTLPTIDWQITMESDHTILLKPDGTLYGVGVNSLGQLGTGDNTDRTTPVLIMTGVKQAAAGVSYTLVLKNDGSAWATGNNFNGQLGTGDHQQHNTFVKVASGVKAIAATYISSFIIKDDGSLWATGFNDFGQLGTGNNSSTTSFTPVKVVTGDVKAIAGTYANTLFIKNDGSVYGAGSNSNNQLGLNQSLTTDRVGSGNLPCTFTPLYITNGVTAAACGYTTFAFILKNDGSAWATGNNFNGQLGTGDNNSRAQFTKVADNVKAIGCGTLSSMILKNDGSLWTAGIGQFGEMGTGNNNAINQFTQVADNVVKIIPSSWNNMIKKNDGSYWGAGYNEYGNLLIGGTSNVSVFTKATLP